MIPRVWPMRDRQLGDRDRSAFARGPTQRNLRVHVDVEALQAEEGFERLMSFAHHDTIDVVELRPKDFTLDEKGVATWSVESVRRDRSRNDGAVVRTHHEEFFYPAGNNLKALRAMGFDLDAEAELEKRALMAMFAWRGCDAFVSSHAARNLASRRYPESNPLSVLEATALIGLFLRLREDFVYWCADGAVRTTTASSFYSTMAEYLLPGLDRWMVHCPEGSTAFEPSPAGLVRGVHERTVRALRARDRLLGQLFRVPQRSTMDDALFYFDGFLVSLTAAFDCAYRLLSRCYALKPTPTLRQPKWTQALLAAQTKFVEVAEGTPMGDVALILHTLRNVLHEEPFKVVGLVDEGGDLLAFQAGLSPKEREHIEVALQRTGGADSWGFYEVGDGAFTIDLHRFTERMLTEATEVIRFIVRTTEVERMGPARPIPAAPRTPGRPRDIADFAALGGLLP